jgi:cyanophycin synthetase
MSGRADVAAPAAFEDSRRLTGPNLYCAAPGAVLEVGASALDATVLQRWQANVAQARAWLDWPADAPCVVRRHARGAALVLAAPIDQLFSATEVDEWAWLAALHEGDGGALRGVALPQAPGYPAAWDHAAAQRTLQLHGAAEADPTLAALAEAARVHALRLLVDDEEVSLGSGAGARVWPADTLPTVAQVPWAELHDIPVALVTGSNGKTTTVRLLAAMLRAHGLRCGYSCTDGLFRDGVRVRAGDYSGPAGARAVLRDPQAQAAVLESARGGMLRRGLALDRAEVAVVTNVSVDHFGEYGIHDLEGLTDVKLIVARALPPGAPLVLNADDPLLRARAPRDGATLAWFARDDAHPELQAARAGGGDTCGVADGVLQLHHRGVNHALGDVAHLPLAFGGHAGYNIANLAAASLAAAALGVDPADIAAVLARFGTASGDNPGRLQHWQRGGVDVFVDYAHNADGLRGLLQVATARRGDGGRLGLLLGQAGNREDAEIRELAQVAATFAPDRIVLKDLAAMLRGRAPGEVPALLHATLREAGVPPAALQLCLDEEAAARALLAWARPGDVVVLPLHGPAARDTIVALLDGGHGDPDWGIGSASR